MKKLMLTIAGLLLISLMAVNAQVVQDTASTATDQPSTGYQTDQADETFQDMDVVEPSEVPGELRSTLQSSQYTGWEEGKVYRHRTTNDYLVVIGDDNAQVYRFDSNGQRIDDQGTQQGQGYQDTQGQESQDMNQESQDLNQESQDLNQESQDLNQESQDMNQDGSGSGTSGSGTGTSGSGSGTSGSGTGTSGSGTGTEE